MLNKIYRTARDFAYHRFYMNSSDKAKITDNFHKLYYNSHVGGGTWENTYWLGTPVWKCPLDLWLYQEILFKNKPDVIIETGTAYGGSAMYLGALCDVLGHGQVITIDIEHKDRPSHPRVTYITGSSTSPEIITQVDALIAGKNKVMVILDSDHSKKHVFDELKVYAPLVHVGQHLIVEDTNINGHPVAPAWGEGPMEAMEEFMKINNDFEIDNSQEKFFLTFNPRGFLKRIK